MRNKPKLKEVYKCWNCSRKIEGDNMMSCPDCVIKSKEKSHKEGYNKALSDMKDDFNVDGLLLCCHCSTIHHGQDVWCKKCKHPRRKLETFMAKDWVLQHLDKELKKRGSKK